MPAVGAFTALVQTALTKRNVLPLRLPPNGVIVASPASSEFAAVCTGVSLKGGVCIAQLQNNRPTTFASVFNLVAPFLRLRYLIQKIQAVVSGG